MKRVEAAAKAMLSKPNRIKYGEDWDSWQERQAQAALEAADAIMFSDEAVERVARLLHAQSNLGIEVWGRFLDDSLVKRSYRNRARAVFAALREEA